MQILLAGTGGQGLILAGIVLAESAVRAGYNALQTQTYGVQSRGGHSQASIIFGDDEINYPEVESPDYCLVLAQSALDGALRLCNQASTLIYDSDTVKVGAGQVPILRGYPITSSGRSLGDLRVLNFVSLGVLLQHLPVEEATVQQVLRKRLPEKIIAKNLSAIAVGLGLSAI